MQFNQAPAIGGGEGTSRGTLVTRYVHSGNQVLQPISVDLATGIFTTAEPIGIVAGAIRSLIICYRDTSNNILPREINPVSEHKIEVIDDTHFALQVSSSRITFPSTSNTAVDVSKFWFEIPNSGAIYIDIEAFQLKRMRLLGYGFKNRPGYSYVYPRFRYGSGLTGGMYASGNADGRDTQWLFWEQQWSILPRFSSVLGECLRIVTKTWNNSNGQWTQSHSSNNLGSYMMMYPDITHFYQLHCQFNMSNNYVIEVYDMGGDDIG